MEFKDALRRFMKERSLSDAHIAISGEVSSSGVRKWLSGTCSPRYATVAKLRKAYPRLGKYLDQKVA